MDTVKPMIYRLSDVLTILAISEATLTRWVEAGKFPKPIQLGVRSRAWLISEVDAWFAEKLANRK